MSNNPVAVYDFTYPAKDLVDPQKYRNVLKRYFKKYAFQLEEGDSGYLHLQGRGSLIKKRRPSELVKLLWEDEDTKGIHVSPTTNEVVQAGEMFYVMKADTRVEGPWTDRDEEIYIPYQYRNIMLYPWQTSVVESAKAMCSRTVNCVVDITGSSGKSTVAAICCLLHKGIRIPAVNDHEKLLASVCDILTAKHERQPGVIFIDLPRYMDKKRMHGIFSAIEEIKNGHAYDMRYHYKEWWYDSPAVWVFTNTYPDTSALSQDRWKLWNICDGELVPVVPGEEDLVLQ